MLQEDAIQFICNILANVESATGQEIISYLEKHYGSKFGRGSQDYPFLDATLKVLYLENKISTHGYPTFSIGIENISFSLTTKIFNELGD